MKTTTIEQEALSKTSGQAAIDEALAVLARQSNKEAVQAAHWMRLEPDFRLFVVWKAKLNRDRANDALSTFTAAERRTIWRVMEMTKQNCEVGQRAMLGGSMPDRTMPDFTAVQENRIKSKNLH